jgi:predicted nucleic acid-binding protein
MIDYPVAVCDACVLFPAPLRDFLVRLAIAGAYKGRWTNEIHGEWVHNVLNARPHLIGGNIERTVKLMNTSVRDCLVSGYEPLIPTLNLPDANDRHVLAAAIHCQANVIVTFNLRDFPGEILQTYGIEALHPDDFVLRLIDFNSTSVCQAARRQRFSLRNPPKSVAEYLSTLEAQSLTQTAARLREFAVVL